MKLRGHPCFEVKTYEKEANCINSNVLNTSWQFSILSLSTSKQSWIVSFAPFSCLLCLFFCSLGPCLMYLLMNWMIFWFAKSCRTVMISWAPNTISPHSRPGSGKRTPRRRSTTTGLASSRLIYGVLNETSCLILPPCTVSLDFLI